MRTGRPRNYYLDVDYFENIDTPEKAYWLGFIVADGYVGTYRLCVRLNAGDRSHLEALNKVLGNGSRIYGQTHVAFGREWEDWTLAVNSKKLTADLSRHGATNRKSLTAEPWCGPDELLPHYWRGLVDGDGWITAKERLRGIGKEPSITPNVGLCGSIAVVQQFTEYVSNSAGFKGNVRQVGKIWEVRYTSLAACQEVIRLLKYRPDFVSLERKRVVASYLLTLVPRATLANVGRNVILELKEKHGAWHRVAKELGVDVSALRRHRKKYFPDLICNPSRQYIRKQLETSDLGRLAS